ncbi:hypothetical protein Mpet_1715 [Methanolacinia petrolearia DSM 11571]|uniref:Zinc-ribbon domain-containing protein n=1 Tax=Methanolacinia petrolearia (strain DSM 11571 / OCM 486 / SEBR 4847) TaxID=679926 RepID=E1RHT0_METP4|nr:hypothetical protein [Methanolacinia petrolearia]ADN36468.1 hypothetical protein Mpet_1715 [Methanolacinia petrolearia DSM 11571]
MAQETSLNSNDDVLAAILGAVIGIVGGFFLISLLEGKKQKCPVCNNNIEQGVGVCPHCGAVLQWS